MKKLFSYLILVLILGYSELIFSATMNQSCNWTGFYLGGSAGYWRSQNNNVTSAGSVDFINQIYEPGASNIANALAQVATNRFSIKTDGLIVGGQAGYNYEFREGVLLGLNISLNGLTNSNNKITLQRTVNLIDYDENYVGSLAVKQKINYMGTVRARLGYDYCQTFLLYATGGFAYGNVRLDTTWTAQESLGPTVFPTISSQNNSNKSLTGWTAGAGIEWLFQPDWSAMLEYTYYFFNNFKESATLAQSNVSITPPVLWGSVNADTALCLSVWDVRVGINYHFL